MTELTLATTTYSMERIDDYVDDGKSKLLSQYQDSYRLNAFLEALLNRVQELEDAIYDVYINSPLSKMYGNQLDRVGLSYGILRNGMNDVNFRLRIITQIQLNLSSGTPEAIIASTKLLCSANEIKYSEVYPAGVSLYIQSSFFNNAMLDQIQGFLMAGVELKSVELSIYDNPFTLAETEYEFYQFIAKVGDEEYIYSTKDDLSTHLIAKVEVAQNLDDSLCFSEMLVNKKHLGVLVDGVIYTYLVSDDAYLEVVPENSQNDYVIIKEGGNLTELIL